MYTVATAGVQSGVQKELLSEPETTKGLLDAARNRNFVVEAPLRRVDRDFPVATR